MARITVEDCLDNVRNRFELVLVASKRARQLVKEGATPLVPVEGDKFTVIALREIAAGFIDRSILEEKAAVPNANEEFIDEVEEELEKIEDAEAASDGDSVDEEVKVEIEAEAGADIEKAEEDVGAALLEALASMGEEAKSDDMEEEKVKVIEAEGEVIPEEIIAETQQTQGDIEGSEGMMHVVEPEEIIAEVGQVEEDIEEPEDVMQIVAPEEIKATEDINEE